jgi:hypothetical protein
MGVSPGDVRILAELKRYVEAQPKQRDLGTPEAL